MTDTRTHHSGVRPAAVAGLFYADDPTRLARTVDALLAEAATPEPRWPKALIVPHAGYPYSGATAAQAFAQLRGAPVARVVLLGPAHRKFVRGVALPSAAYFESPLGRVRLDTTMLAALAQLPFAQVDDAAHAQEHSLEVQLPFLAQVLADFILVPVLVGDATPDEVSQLLAKVWGGPETLVLISSDLSHFESYEHARQHDRQTITRILAGDDTLDGHDACGAAPLNGFLRVARAHGLAPRLIDARNSGDTAGDRTRVVGYCAIAFESVEAAERVDAPASDAALGHALLAHARAAIAAALGIAAAPAPTHPGLAQPGATFVTLTRHGALRGCIGSLAATRTLTADVAANARAAAFEDPRFAPLSREEFSDVAIEVSVLSPPVAMSVRDEADACAQLRPGIDGVVLEAGAHRATFLPQVWSQLPTPREFLASLKRKAGLGAHDWAPTFRLSRYTVRKWHE